MLIDRRWLLAAGLGELNNLVALRRVLLDLAVICTNIVDMGQSTVRSGLVSICMPNNLVTSIFTDYLH